MVTRRGVLWDMDGVLVDTGEFHYLAWKKVLPEYGIPISREVFQSTFGMNNEGVLTALLGYTPEPELLAEISERKEHYFRLAIRGRAQLLPGVARWLERLRQMGSRQAIASSAPRANIDALVEELNLRPYFQAIVSGVDLPSKPDPSVFLRAADMIGVPPEDCIVVEDSVAGVEAARRAGMACIAVTTTSSAEALQSADIVVARLDALPENAFSRLWSGGTSNMAHAPCSRGRMGRSAPR